MNRIEIQQEQGFPVRQKTFEFMQEAYTSAIQHLCKTYGENIILYGVELVNGNRTAGAVVINGELLPFEASPDAPKIAIVETVENALYQDNIERPAYKTRVAKCGDAGVIDLADLKRINENTDWINCEKAAGFDFYNFSMKSRKVNGRIFIDGEFTTDTLTIQFPIVVCTLPFSVKKRAPVLIYSLGKLHFEGTLRIGGIGYVDIDSRLYIVSVYTGNSEEHLVVFNAEII
jgi:hypothetical protein